MSCNTQTRNLGPRNILLGKDTYQAGCITTVADVAASLQNSYFVMHEPVTQTKHVFWFNVATLGTDPLVPNATAHPIAISSGATASAVASAAQAVIDALTWVVATVSANHITITYATYGYAYEMRDAIATADKTGFTLTTSTFGQTQVDLGGTEGDVVMTVEEQNVEVKSPQTGNFVTAEIRQGATLGVSFSLQDTSQTAIRRAMNFYGSTIVPDNGSGAVLSGYGSSNLFKSTDDVATQLILRPSKLAGIPDKSEDFTMPKAKLKLGELTFSAENILVLPIEATAYLDTSDNAFLNFFSYGDKSSL